MVKLGVKRNVFKDDSLRPKFQESLCEAKEFELYPTDIGELLQFLKWSDMNSI